MLASFRPPGQAAIAVPACRATLMPGCAFSIEDALVACRWAEQILPRGYRVVITPRYKHAEEVIEVCIPKTGTPVFRVHCTPHLVLVTDCIGLTLSFPALADALLAMVPLSKLGRREMLYGADPPWLPRFPACPTTKLGGAWLHAGRLLARTTAALIRWNRGQHFDPTMQSKAQSGVEDNSGVVQNRVTREARLTPLA